MINRISEAFKLIGGYNEYPEFDTKSNRGVRFVTDNRYARKGDYIICLKEKRTYTASCLGDIIYIEML